MINNMRILILKRHKEAILSGLAMFLKDKYFIDFSIVGTLEGTKSELRRFRKELHAIIVGQYLESGSGLELIHYANELIPNISILLATIMPVVDKRVHKYKNVKVYKVHNGFEHLMYYYFLEEQYKRITNH